MSYIALIGAYPSNSQTSEISRQIGTDRYALVDKQGAYSGSWTVDIK